MATRIGGERRKTRGKFKKPLRTKGKISLRNYLSLYQPGTRVLLSVEPAVQTGMYHPRFMGKPGTILGKQGNCYRVAIQDKAKTKELIVHPVHLREYGKRKNTQ